MKGIQNLCVTALATHIFQNEFLKMLCIHQIFFLVNVYVFMFICLHMYTYMALQMVLVV